MTGSAKTTLPKKGRCELYGKEEVSPTRRGRRRRSMGDVSPTHVRLDRVPNQNSVLLKSWALMTDSSFTIQYDWLLVNDGGDDDGRLRWEYSYHPISTSILPPTQQETFGNDEMSKNNPALFQMTGMTLLALLLSTKENRHPNYLSLNTHLFNDLLHVDLFNLHKCDSSLSLN